MSQVSEKRAVVLVSGGLDSSTVLAMAKEQGYRCYALSFDYGQRHKVELQAADRIAQQMGAIEHKTVPIDLREIGGSALTDSTIDVPEEMVS
ncbi:MAG TPA: 7-cyano-7-deazaguanine synthase, partial [Gammaproteobacteria bacterium]|nr:7-cyano-7-deazaguanine synthase [Gammaproteobacteria bacterium]